MGLETLEMMFGDVLDRKEGLLDTYICIYVTKRFSLIAILDFLWGKPMNLAQNFKFLECLLSVLKYT